MFGGLSAAKTSFLSVCMHVQAQVARILGQIADESGRQNLAVQAFGVQKVKIVFCFASNVSL